MHHPGPQPVQPTPAALPGGGGTSPPGGAGCPAGGPPWWCSCPWTRWARRWCSPARRWCYARSGAAGRSLAEHPPGSPSPDSCHSSQAQANPSASPGLGFSYATWEVDSKPQGLNRKWKSLSRVRLFETLWTAKLLSMGFSRPQYWSG